MKLSVLDQSPSALGTPPSAAITASLALAQRCEALDLYRTNYRPSARYPEPRATICVWALAAGTEAEAARQLMTRKYWRVRFEQGLLGPLVSPDTAAAHPYSLEERHRIEGRRRHAMVGTGSQAAAKIRPVADGLGLSDIVANTWAFDSAVRSHSYALLAQAFKLQQEP